MKRRYWIGIGIAIALLAAGGLAAYALDELDVHGIDDLHYEWRRLVGGGDNGGLPTGPEGGDRAARGAGSTLALEEALKLATTYVPGEVIKVERDRDDGREVFEIKVIAENGRVRELKLDAHSGELLEIEDD